MEEQPLYTGLYVNLDRSTERRRRLEEQLAKFNLSGRYSRFEAVDGLKTAARAGLRPAEVACFHSHYRALMKGRESGLPVHILEDDILLSQYLDGAARKLVSSNFFGQFDIVFTETFVHPNVLRLASHKQEFDKALAGGSIRFRVVDLKEWHLAGMTSYFVAAASIDKVLGILAEELERGPRMPVDGCLRLAAHEGRLKVGCWFPFVTSIMLDCITTSTIAGREKQEGNSSIILAALLRYSFFIDRDLEGYARPFLEALVGDESEKPVDVHRDFIVKLLEFIVAGRYRTF
jgi:GR25 family glycosyltransferase involved in LPS biosynthesis